MNFREQLIKKLEESGISSKDLAREFTIPLEVVERWISGDSEPHPIMHKYVYEFLDNKY